MDFFVDESIKICIVGGMTEPEDIKLSRKYCSKFQDAKKRGIEFSISFTSYKNMMRAKKCAVTGILLTNAVDSKTRLTDRTIDRIDASKGYVSGNVMAVCHAVNKFKNLFEGQSVLTVQHAKKILKILEEA